MGVVAAQTAAEMLLTGAYSPVHASAWCSCSAGNAATAFAGVSHMLAASCGHAALQVTQLAHVRAGGNGAAVHQGEGLWPARVCGAYSGYGHAHAAAGHPRGRHWPQVWLQWRRQWLPQLQPCGRAPRKYAYALR